MNKKPPKKTSLKRRATSSRESVAKLRQTIAAQAREIRQAAEQQAATSEILRIISSSPTDVQRVFDIIVSNAAQLCEGSGASVVRFDGGELLYLVAQYKFWLRCAKPCSGCSEATNQRIGAGTCGSRFHRDSCTRRTSRRSTPAGLSGPHGGSKPS
jgi:hypothetical protein